MSEQTPDYSRMDETEEDRLDALRSELALFKRRLATSEECRNNLAACLAEQKIGPTTFKLMTGMEINFAGDGTWLAFKDSDGDSAVVRLENIASASGRIVVTTIQKWSEDRRKELGS
jgi:hypothetical protein